MRYRDPIRACLQRLLFELIHITFDFCTSKYV